MMSGNVIPGRFVEARIELGMTHVKLSELSGVSRPTITALEKGLLLSPRIDTVAKIAWALHKPVDFFYTQKQDNFEPTTVSSFRSLKGKTKTHNKQAEIVIERYLEFLDILYEYIEPRFCDIPLELYCTDPLTLSDVEIESSAAAIRDHWKMSDGPIINLCVIFENHGIFCHQHNLPAEIDSINRSFRPKDDSREVPIIAVNASSSYFRQRFDLAHELGHIVLHHFLSEEEYIKNLDVYEQQANRFASAFLMPYASFSDGIPGFSMSSIRYMKEKWRVSMAAIIYRLAEVYRISASFKQSLFVTLSKRGWRKKEPLDDAVKPEEPYYLPNAYSFLLQSKAITAKNIEDMTGLFREDIIEYIGNREWFYGNIPDNDYALKR